MIYSISPLEVLAAFFLAFLSGIVFGLGLTKYAERIRKQTLCEIQAQAAMTS